MTRVCFHARESARTITLDFGQIPALAVFGWKDAAARTANDLPRKRTAAGNSSDGSSHGKARLLLAVQRRVVGL